MKDLKQLSKFLSLVLRHQPEVIGIRMDSNGWVLVDELIEACVQHQYALDFNTLDELVGTSDKQRFAFNDDLTKIRANQGHSISVDLELKPIQPPEILYHGTVSQFMDSIQEKGLQKQNRLHVHLSSDRETAIKVAGRRGKPIILKVLTSQMYEDGYSFYLSENKVWLCDEVPFAYILIENQS